MTGTNAGADFSAMPALPKRRKTVCVANLNGRVLVSADELAALLGVGGSTLTKWRKAGALPAPVRVGHVSTNRTRSSGGPEAAVRWRLAEILDWAAAGCPLAADWRWRPTLRMRMQEYEALLKRQVSELQREIDSLERLKATGETWASVRGT